MAASTAETTLTHSRHISELLDILASAASPRQLLEGAWRWINGHVPVDAVGVVSLGPPEPIGYLFTSGPVLAATEARLWACLISSASAVASEGVTIPRRSGDQRAWHGDGNLLTNEEEPIVVGQWMVTMAAAPAALVQIVRLSPCESDMSLPAFFEDMGLLLGLYVRGLHTRTVEIVPEARGDLPFEKLLEQEVARARQSDTAVSLVLVELQVNGLSGQETMPSPEELAEAERIVNSTARRGDLVRRLCDNCLAIIMPKTDARGALVGADRIREALSKHFVQTNPKLSVRIGVGGRDPNETEASELFARASQALAQARFAHSPAAFLYV